MRAKITAAALTTVLALVVVACGDDDGDEAGSEAAGDTTTTTEAGLGTEACDAVLGVGTALTSGPDGPPTPEYLEGELQPALDAVVASGAEELSRSELQTCRAPSTPRSRGATPRRPRSAPTARWPPRSTPGAATKPST